MSDRVYSIQRMWILAGLVWALAACSAPALTDQDRIGTRVAEDRAVAATLTSSAPTLPPPTNPPLPTNTPPASATAVATIAEPPSTPTPTVTPRQVVPSVPPATATPTLVAIVPPTPTREATLVAVVPGFGTTKGLTGQIVLPGYSGPLDPPVFRDSIAFKLVVFDPAFGKVDGAGIKTVNIEAVDPLGRTVIEQSEGSWAYCAFGNPQNSPDCDVWRFGEHNFKWPNGTPVCAGSGYSVNMVVKTEDPDKDGANWRFEFAVESPNGSLPNCF